VSVRRSSSPHSSRLRGTLATIRRGIARLSAYTRTRERGTRTPETATTEGCSFYLLPGRVPVAGVYRVAQRRVSSCTERGSSTGATVTRGASGAPREPADSGEAWERANREALR
jgi:hypothetical protein